MLKWLSIVMMFIVFIALLAVTLGNTHSVDFNLVGLPTTTWPLVVFLWMAFVIGALVGVLSMLGRLLRLRGEAADLSKKLKKAQQANVDLQAQLDQQGKPVAMNTADVIVPVQP
ncbi:MULTISPECIES: LapA family protein [Vitreoscilla]|uniref:LapA family protein n=1 Tax=Vitreoscilla stercoraria TaxID=61 RepID=A0ABY4E7H7_VITST|nr:MULTISPECIES: LapA family protein [Vitreoscilla]AUZ04945.1 hypothetical protein ADP71_13250 [Vitreoscilla sp. C1]UOO91409.1 LapA family protein [Vitreoscilla stercoraria]